MPEYPPVAPYLLYADAASAIDWLSRAFGFRERLRYTEADGRVSHAELVAGDGLVMLGNPGDEYRSPRDLGAVTASTYVYVDDVEAHFEAAKSAGATMLSTVQDQSYGDRSYSAADLDGHRWTFASRLRDVAPEEWGATTP